MVPEARVFIQRIRRDGVIEEATADTVLQEGDVVAVAGPRNVLVELHRRSSARKLMIPNCWPCRSRAWTSRIEQGRRRKDP